MTITLIIIFTIIGIVQLIISLSQYHYQKLTKSNLIYLIVFSLSIILTGISFTQANHFTRFGFTHLMMMGLSLMIPISLKIQIKNKQVHRYLLIGFSLFTLAMTLLKFSFPISFYRMLPFNVCNLVAIMISIRPIYKNELFDNYILCFGIIGGMANNLLGVRFNESFYNIEVFESNVIHFFFLIYSLYILITGEAIPNPKKAMGNFVWLIPFFIILVFLNEIHQFNFFFTSRYENPIVVIYQLFPTFFISFLGYQFEINLIYYLIVILGAFIIHLGIIYLLVYLVKKLKLNPSTLPS